MIRPAIYLHTGILILFLLLIPSERAFAQSFGWREPGCPWSPYQAMGPFASATSGYDARTDLRQVFYRHLTILGSMMGAKAELLDAMKFVESGQIRAVVDRTLPLAEARRAHELMEDRAQFGKIILVP